MEWNVHIHKSKFGQVLTNSSHTVATLVSLHHRETVPHIMFQYFTYELVILNKSGLITKIKLTSCSFHIYCPFFPCGSKGLTPATRSSTLCASVCSARLGMQTVFLKAAERVSSRSSSEMSSSRSSPREESHWSSVRLRPTGKLHV